MLDGNLVALDIEELPLFGNLWVVVGAELWVVSYIGWCWGSDGQYWGSGWWVVG